MPYTSRQVREYAGGSIGGILRKGSSNSTSVNLFPTSTSGPTSHGGEIKQIDLLVFGYACKVFRDDDKAREIDQGKHLIPWMGDSSLKIDRYDVRGALYDLAPHEVPPGGYGNRLDYLTADEQRAEQLCEEERYFFLYNNEEQHILEQEEELKRFKQESEGSGPSYNQVGLQYNDASDPNSGDILGPKREEFANSPTCEEADQAFVLPNNFVVPPSIELPETMKQHAIIEKTARFIASQGIQMEILLKAKQSNNLQFEFLTQNSSLNPYYKFVHNAIKEGTYPAPETSKASASDNLCQEDTKEDDASNAVESVLASRPVITVPTIKYKPSANCAYTQLISKIKGVPLLEVIDEHRNSTAASAESEYNSPSSTSNAGTADGENFTPVLLQYNGQTYITASTDNEEALNSKSNSATKNATTSNSPPKVEILKNSSAFMLAQNYSSDSESDNENERMPSNSQPSPPPAPALKLTFPIPGENLRNIIDKTASYVIKNGRQFEETLRAKSEERFTFLLPENEFYPYYMYKITGDPDAASIEQKTKKAAAVAAALMSKKKLLQGVDRNSAHVSFSIKPKDDQLQPTLPQDASDEDEENAATHDKQLSNSTDSQQRTVPDHVKKAIQLVESQLMARNAQLAAVAGANNLVLPCNLSTAIRSRFDLDYNGQLAKPTLFSGNAISNAEMERNAIYEQQQQNRHKELKRAEEKVKDKLAQIAREKLGGLISKEKQLQLERKRKAMAFLNQIKGPSENELTPDKKSLNDNGNASDSESSVHSIPITSYGPDENSDEEQDRIPTPPPPPPMDTLVTASHARTPSPRRVANNRIIKITADVTLSDDDDVQVVSETRAQKRPRLITVTVQNYKSKEAQHRRSRSRSRTHDEHRSRNSSVESIDNVEYSTRRRSHKSKKSTTKIHRKKSKSKSKVKSKTRTRSRSRSIRRSCSFSPSPPHNKSHLSRHSHSIYRTSRSRYSRSLSADSRASPLNRRHQYSKHSRSPKRRETRRKREDYSME